jgi:hypothetical protein
VTKAYIIAAQIVGSAHIESTREFPPRQRPGSVDLAEIMDAMDNAMGAGAHESGNAAVTEGGQYARP